MDFYNKVKPSYLLMCTDEESCSNRLSQEYNKDRNDLYELLQATDENSEKQIKHVFVADTDGSDFTIILRGSQLILP